MKTHNYDIELMLPMQTDKEIIFNEAQNIIDSFCNYSVNDFASDIQNKKIEAGAKYIITSGARQNQICFCASQQAAWQYLIPKDGMIIFIRAQNSFFLFINNHWQKTTSGLNTRDKVKFIGIEKDHMLNVDSKILYLYLNNKCVIHFSEINLDEFIIIIKQNVNTPYQLIWSPNIIWPSKLPHKMTQIPNSIDVIRCYSLAETGKFLGEVIKQNYQQ